MSEKFSNILFRQKMSEFGFKNSRKLAQVKLCHTIRPNPKMSEKVFKNITKTNRIQKCQQIRSRPKFSFGKFLTFFLTFSDDFLLSWYRFLTFLNSRAGPLIRWFFKSRSWTFSDIFASENSDIFHEIFNYLLCIISMHQCFDFRVIVVSDGVTRSLFWRIARCRKIFWHKEQE